MEGKEGGGKWERDVATVYLNEEGPDLCSFQLLHFLLWICSLICKMYVRWNLSNLNSNLNCTIPFLVENFFLMFLLSITRMEIKVKFSFSYIKLFPLLVYMCIYMFMHVHICACVHVGHRLTLSVFLNHSPSLHFLRQSISLNLEVTDLATLTSQPASSGFSCLYLCSSGMMESIHPLGTGNPSSGPHTCIETLC